MIYLNIGEITMGLFGGGKTTTTTDYDKKGSSGGLNISQSEISGLQNSLQSILQGSGVAELTPELQQALQSMMGSQSGTDALNQGQNLIGQASGIIGQDLSTSASDIKNTAQDLVNQEFLNQQISQLSKASQDNLTNALTNISQGATMGGGLGSSRTALAQGQAIGDANEALTNATQNLIGQTYQNALTQAMDINKTNIGTALQQGSLLGQIGQGQSTLGQGMNQDRINAMLKAGMITHDQANKLKNQDLDKMNAYLNALGVLQGKRYEESGHTTSTQKQKKGFGDMLLGLGMASLGGFGNSAMESIGKGAGDSLSKKFFG